MRFESAVVLNGKTATGIPVPREVVEALGAAREYFDGPSYSQKRWFTLGLAGAKKPETRARRLEKYVEMIAEGPAR